MPVTTWHASSITGEAVSGESANEWVKPGFAQNDDTSYATADPGATDKDGQSYDKFGFAIPSGDSIDGIEISLIAKLNESGNATKIRAQMFKWTGFGRGLQGVSNDVGPWTLDTDQTFTFGGATELWGTTWTATEINAIETGFFFLAQHDTTNGMKLNVDYISMRVWHSSSGTNLPILRRRREEM